MHQTTQGIPLGSPGSGSKTPRRERTRLRCCFLSDHFTARISVFVGHMHIHIYIYIHIHLAPETGSTHGRRDRMIPSWGSSPYLMPIFYGFHHMQHASFPIQLYWRHSIQNLTTSKRTANWLEASVCLDLAGGHELLFWLLNRLVYFLYGYLSPK